tara:strand:+ start:390 stop:572 length:183 start_codon:yes stop_codon:yes gene_type:complete
MKVGDIVNVIQDDIGDFPGISVHSIGKIDEENVTLSIKHYNSTDDDYQEGVKIKEEFDKK